MKSTRTGRLAITAGVLLATALPSWAIGLDDVLARLNEAQPVMDAQLARSIAQKEVELAGFSGDLAVEVQPSVTVVTPADGPFADEVRLAGSASVLVPLGLTATQESGLERAMEAVVDAELTVQRALEQATYDLITLYQQAWLAQVERAVLETELLVARQVAETNERLFESGLVSLNVLVASRDEVSAAEVAYLENTRDVRIQWLALAYAANLDPELTPELDAPALEMGDLPPPPELTQWALRTDRVIAAQKARIDSLESALAEPARDSIVQTARVNLSAASHNVSIAYNPGAASLTGNYSFPIATIGGADTSSGSGSADSWNFGFSVSLAVGTTHEATLEREVLLVQLEAAMQELGYLEDVIALTVRERYQQYLLAQGTVDQAVASVSAANANLDLINRRQAEERATAVDVAAAQARLARADFGLTLALAKLDEVRLAAALYAGYLSEIRDEEEEL